MSREKISRDDSDVRIDGRGCLLATSSHAVHKWVAFVDVSVIPMAGETPARGGQTVLEHNARSLRLETRRGLDPSRTRPGLKATTNSGAGTGQNTRSRQRARRFVPVPGTWRNQLFGLCEFAGFRLIGRLLVMWPFKFDDRE
jgi:hypothetical protein